MADTLILWLDASAETITAYRRMIDAAVAQLSDEEVATRPAPSLNSVAIILRHLAGNLRSRWTDFLTTDGEKPDRDRDVEFVEWTGDRASLLAEFDRGWACLAAVPGQVNEANIDTPIFIRGERHSIPQALSRSLAHVAYHTGQILMIARAVHADEWRWLTIAPGRSATHNQTTWGTAASRGVFGSDGKAV
jgi:uncharacterized damage-inducible protein DinB